MRIHFAGGSRGSSVKRYRWAGAIHESPLRKTAVSLAFALGATAGLSFGADGGAVRLNNEGNRRMTEKKPDAAEESYRKAAKADPKEAAIQFNLAAALAAQGKVPEALETYRKALQNADGKTAADIYYNQGNLLMNLADQAQHAPAPSGGAPLGSGALPLAPGASPHGAPPIQPGMGAAPTPQAPNAPALSPDEALKGAVQSYRETLRRRPEDQDGKYNLETALRRLAALPPPPPPQPNQGDSKKDSKEDKSQEQQESQPQPQDSKPEKSEDQKSPSESAQQQDPQEQKAQPDSASSAEEKKSESQPASEETRPEDEKKPESAAQETPPSPSEKLKRDEARRLLDRLADEERRQFLPPRHGQAEERPPEKDW